MKVTSDGEFPNTVHIFGTSFLYHQSSHSRSPHQSKATRNGFGIIWVFVYVIWVELEYFLISINNLKWSIYFFFIEEGLFHYMLNINNCLLIIIYSNWKCGHGKLPTMIYDLCMSTLKLYLSVFLQKSVL